MWRLVLDLGFSGLCFCITISFMCVGTKLDSDQRIIATINLTSLSSHVG